MLDLLLISLVMTAAPQNPQTIVQKTSGWCSPVIANVVGNVTVTCIGVDPRALRRLNAELNRKNLELADKILVADEWTKKYKELEKRLNDAPDDVALSSQVEEYLHQGDLEKAGRILDQMLVSQEKQIDKAAETHYKRALTFELQFQPLDALPHLEKAYRYRPEDVSYGLSYASLLGDQREFRKAEPVFLATLDRARELAKSNPAVYLPKVAQLLNNLAVVDLQTQQLKAAETQLLEALSIRRRLAKDDPDFRAYLAQSLDNLGSLYRDTQRVNEAEAAYKESLDIGVQVAKADTDYLVHLADTLSNLAVLYKRARRLNEAQTAYEDALSVFRQLAKTNPGAYQPHVALALNNLGNLYRAEEKMKEAEEALVEALNIRRELGNSNPAAYRPYVASTLNNLANLYYVTKRLKEARTTYNEGLGIDRELAEANSSAYRPYIATALSNLASLDFDSGNPAQARVEIDEAVGIRRELWKANPEAAGEELAQSLFILARVLASLHQPEADACAALREAKAVGYDVAFKRRIANDELTMCPTP
jgi:tetratricopeptide (TPR) repeat protein